MKNKILIISMVVFLVIAIIGAIFIIQSRNEKNVGYHDGINGEIVFNKLNSSEIAYGVSMAQGESPLDINLEKGKLNIKIKKGKDVIYEETNIEESKKITIDIPEEGFYFISLSGKKASGTIYYEVNDEVAVDDEEIFNSLGIETTEEQEIVKKAVLDNYINEFGDTIKEINYTKVKIYTKQEIEKDDLLKNYDIGENDIVFEINYELEIAENYDDIMQFTASTGEIDGNWVKEKYNCGIARYKSDGSYEITDFGTSF